MAAHTINRVWDLLERKGWCKNRSAINKAGISVSIDSPKATAFCASAGLARVYGQAGVREEKEEQLWLAIKARSNFCSVIDWNDSCRMQKSTVVRLLKKLDI